MSDPIDPTQPAQVDPHASTSSGLGDAIELARPADPAALLLARARVAGSLFGPDHATGLGRFRVLEPLGAGGMGVVYAAYDPDLDRGVALKLVQVRRAFGRDAALAEAKALARLSHPHVVPIYDVGIEEDHVFIVMELVRGATLGKWAAERDAREIVAMYLQAGAALAAAHAAGLVHRDFKPDNAIVGKDGRVRVVDFGLACEAADGTLDSAEPRPVAGTRRYMAPEQAAGAAVTPAADQYSFCVSLAESLGEGDVPRWLAAVIERGKSADPAARYPSMAELLRALARDPARAWRRGLVLLAAAAVVGTGAFVAGRGRTTDPLAACDGGETELAATWGPEGRASALARIANLGPYRPSVEHALAEHAARWTAGRRDACLAHRRGAQSDALFDRRMACLERGRAALAAVAGIVAHAGPDNLKEVPLAVSALPDPAACGDVDALLATVAPPAPAVAARVEEIRRRLEAVRVHIAAGRFAEARSLAQPCVTDAEAVAYRPLLAEALLTLGQATMNIDRAGAVPILRRASTEAMSAGADALAIEAWARRAWVEGTQIDPQAALGGRDLVEAMSVRLETGEGRFARALLYNNIGSVELSANHRDQARAALLRALDESKGLSGAAGVELLAVRSNLALVTDDAREADRVLAEAVAEWTRLVGEDHPNTLEIQLMRGTTTIGGLAAAAELLARTCRQTELHPALAQRTAFCWGEVGYLAAELGDRAQAIDALERATRVSPAGPTPLLGGYLLLWRGDEAGAAQGLAEAVAATRVDPDSFWWVRFERAELELALGRAHRAAGNLRAAWQALDASAADLQVIAKDHPAAFVTRRLGRARVELALTLAARGVVGVAPIAAQAVSWLREVGGRQDEIAELDRLVAAGGR